jgi:hypothetical protein
VDVMPAICADYDKEHYDRYDIGCMTIEEERNYVMYNVMSYDEDTTAALCWGIEYMYLNTIKDKYFLLSKVLIRSCNFLDLTDRALFFDLEDAEKEMQKWTEQNREHLLCYIIREIPKEKVFRDELESSLCGWPDEPYIEDREYLENVYMPSGYKRKHHFEVGDLVEYIYHDEDMTTLKWGCIAKLPNKKDTGVLILDGKTTWERLSKKAFIANNVKVPLRYVFPLKHC